MTKPGKNAFFFVIVTVMLDMMGFGLIVPVIPALLTELSGLTAEEAVVWGGALTATYALMNFIAGPAIGNLSDRFGRRPVLLLSIGTLAIDFLIMGFANTLAILFVGRALAGISSATFSTANAYIADVTDPEDRGRAFGFTGAAFGLGFIVGPAAGGLLAEAFGTRAPFFVAAALAGINFLYGAFVLPESLKPENRRALDWKRANPLGAFRHFAKVPQVAWFLVVLGLFALATSVYPATWSFHGVIRYDWSEGEIGASLALVGLGAAVVQAGALGWVIKTFGLPRTIAIGLAFNATAMVGFTFAGAPWLAYVFIPVSSVGGILGPSINAMISNLTPADAQGELQGASSSLQSLAIVFAPVMMTQTLHTFSKDDAIYHFPGAAFLLAASLVVACAIPFVIGLRANEIRLTDPKPVASE
ncbi:MAG: TCR/Tet family MFS transporter [Pseudomonadota bacterium]